MTEYREPEVIHSSAKREPRFCVADISFLFHCYTTNEPWPHPSMTSKRSIRKLWQDGLITIIKHEPDNKETYQITEKGDFYISMLLNTPLPIQKWSRP